MKNGHTSSLILNSALDVAEQAVNFTVLPLYRWGKGSWYPLERFLVPIEEVAGTHWRGGW
jgi:hypothetical protein